MKLLHTWQRAWRMRNLRDPSYAFLFDPPPDDHMICLDLETTGLNPSRAEILSIGAVPVVGDKILTSRALRLLVKPEGEIDPETIRIHGLRPIDVENGLPADEAVRILTNFMGSRPLLGYYLEFDMAMVDKYLEPMCGVRLPNRRIEVSEVYYRHKLDLTSMATPYVDLSFEAIRRDLGVPLLDPHDAMGDALMTAMMYIRLSIITRQRRSI
ncbi:MAG: 3'-5' exonuclease [Magnetococcales bacterium]|nr:3'-5' exonuclease [Magnetococcales bacterium]NGZ26051.1 3'-5' exonuclease [Magnetococcales bacterium]